jgi:ribose-phosphate pyrophosphokinase
MIEFLASGSADGVVVQTLRFPAGEPHVVQGAEGALAGDRVALLRGCDADELVTVLMWAEAVRSDGGRPHLLLPYLPGARADREPRLEARIYADLINAGRFETVVALDPHSAVMPGMTDRLVVVSAVELVDRFLPVRL